MRRSDRPQGSGRWWRSQRGKWGVGTVIGGSLLAIMIYGSFLGVKNHPPPSTTGPETANAQAQATPTPIPPDVSNISADHQSLLAQAGVPRNEWPDANYVITKESGWQVTVWNHAGSGAYGLCQALPATKLASAGVDWETNPVTQLRWCNKYAHDTYHSWAAAKAWWDRTDCRAPPGASRCYSEHWW